MQELKEPDYQKKLDQSKEIIKGAKGLEGLSNLKQWKEVVNWINRRIEALKRYRDSILLGINKDIPTDRELAEVKATAREIKAFEEIRDIEKSFTKEVNKAIEDKKKYQKRIEEQKKPKPRRTHAY